MRCCTTAEKLILPSFSGPGFPVLTSAIPALLQESICNFSYWSDCKPRGPTRSSRSPTATSALQKSCPCTARKAAGTARTLSHNCRQFPHQIKDLGGQKATVVCASFWIMSLSALWSSQLVGTLGTGGKITPAFWGCIGKRGALGLCHCREVTLTSPRTLWGTAPIQSPWCPQELGTPSTAGSKGGSHRGSSLRYQPGLSAPTAGIGAIKRALKSLNAPPLPLCPPRKLQKPPCEVAAPPGS